MRGISKTMLMIVVMIPMVGVRAQEWHQQWKHPWDIDSPLNMQLSSDGVDVIVEAGARNGGIDAVLEAKGFALGKPMANIDYHQTGTSILINVYARPFVGVRFLRLHIHVPQTLQAEVLAGSGNIMANGLSGTLRLSTATGGVRVRAFYGKLQATTDSGPIDLQGRLDDLNLQTRSGAIKVDLLPGSHLQTDWLVQSEVSSVTLNIPSSLTADLAVRTNSGHIVSELPVVTRGLNSKHQLQGRLNGGGLLLLICGGNRVDLTKDALWKTSPQ